MTAAVIGDPTVSAVTEDVGVVGGNLVAAGTISISDPDAGENAFQTSVQGQQGNLGALVLASDGSYTYTVANAATQSLGLGDTHIDTFTITSVDGTTKQISFTINGANDGAVIGDPTVSAVTEDVGVVGGNLVAAGTISISDPDAGENAFQTSVQGQQGNLGALVLASDGSYTYTVANAATQSLGLGDTHIDTFTITSVDGTTKQISFTINGANDGTGAVIGDPTVSAVTEDVGVVGGNLVAAGTISILDPDAGENAFQTSVQGQQGNLGALAWPATAATPTRWPMPPRSLWAWATRTSIPSRSPASTGRPSRSASPSTAPMTVQ